MSEMKNTNTEWLKYIPAHWGLSKISTLYTLRNQKVNDRDYPPLSVTMKGILPQLDTAAKTNAHDDRKLVLKGDFAINSRSDRRGSCGISDYDGSVSLINTVMKPNKEMNPGYYNWLFHTTEFADEFYKWGHGIVDDLWTTNWQDMKHIDVPVPPLSEQHHIAEFLDSKCSQIDEISKKIQEEIETLEEYKKSIITESVTKGLDPNVETKDSGIKCFGSIPSNWDVKKIKNVFSLKSIKSGGKGELLSVYLDKGVISYSDSTGMQVHKPSQDLSNYQVVDIGDFVLNNQQAWRGSVGVSRYKGIISPAYVVYAMNKKCAPCYMSFLLRDKSMVQQYELSSRGVGTIQRNIFVPWLRECVVLVPPLAEQYRIADYLDEKCSKIDETISKKQQQLTTLEEYKKSLIYEYVTGKKEVA